MADETVTRPQGWLPHDSAAAPPKPRLALFLVWSQAEPARVGEVALLPDEGTVVLGRGVAGPGDSEPRLVFGQARPAFVPAAPLTSPGLSRRQLVLRSGHERVAVERVGRAALRFDGRRVDRCDIGPGDILELEREALLLCHTHTDLGPGGARPGFGFGRPDPHGFVGESSRVWALRDEVARAARRPHHVLVTGPSGAGKELAARAIHALSERAAGPFIARNAATLPQGILDAELFGSARNFPNAGMPERPGIIGESDGGTLFLDEIGELPDALQAHFLRVLDAGEFHRLGEGRARRVDVRVIAATNRDPLALKHDFRARFKLTLSVPGLDERREDVPILARALLHGIARHDPSVMTRFFEEGEPRMEPKLARALVEYTWTGHVRELEELLLLAVAESREHFLELTPGLVARLRRPAPRRPPVPRTSRPPPTRPEVEHALAASGGNVSQAWKELGLPSRDALNRLIRKLGVRIRRE